MKKVFAILYEPASYTVDRNEAVYDKLGIGYCYMKADSLAKADCLQVIDVLPSDNSSLKAQLEEILRNNDIVIMNGYTGKVFCMLFLLNMKYRRTIGIDSDTQLVIPSNFIKRLFKAVYLNIVFRNKHIYGLAGGTKTHKDLFRYYGMKEERIFLSPMMVNNDKFRYHGHHGGDVFMFLYVGRIIKLKNIQLMIDAFLSAFDCIPNVELHIVGKGDLLDGYQKQYVGNKNVVFDGPKYNSNLVDAYRQANVFILPSSHESWGLVVNEAMASGLPCIVSNQVGAAWDLVEGKNTGFVFKCNDADELASRMKQLVEDNELYRQYSKNAYDLMHDYWNYNFYTDCLKKFINEA